MANINMEFHLVIDAPSAALTSRPEPSQTVASPLPIAKTIEPPAAAVEAPDWSPIWGVPPSPAVPLEQVPRTIVDLNARPFAEDQFDVSPTPRDEAPAEITIDDARPIAEQQDDSWFTLLASSATEQQRVAADKLYELGYGHVTPRDARMLVSTSLRDRLALVDLALTSPRLESDKWLWRLAQDRSGEVRAAAIASIATSKDAGLIEKAMELTLHDTDPRVAEQSRELRRRLR